ncbi:transmembrane amino acid transporter protein-domain-containing protein [Lentinula aff. detonsa]|nr:transmembrane amino acid transporter protein-domain-containing protein [Lentinula aff. detonsa]
MSINKVDEKSSVEGSHDFTPDLKESAIPITQPTLRDYLIYASVSRSNETKPADAQIEVEHVRKTEHQRELDQARRALRTATWVSVFYLITTDILGPFNAPYAFSQVGYVPGAVLYVVMGGVACFTGLQLWRLFCRLDSHEYPVKTYGDLAERILGREFKHFCTVLQSLQLIINVGVICLSNAQSLEQLAANHQFCFSVSVLIWAIVGMLLGQVRSLQKYGFFANSAVWLNLLIIFTSMGFIAHSPPNFAAALKSLNQPEGPVQTAKFVSLPLFDKVNGIMQMVFAYGGAMIFPEFLAEMRRPMDFWKGMICAQMLICTAYLMYGLFVYSFQGQFTLPLAYQGVSRQSWQDVGNVFALITGIIAAGLYGNIGIKVAYYSIIEDWFKGPALTSRTGRLIWTGMVLLYWSLAFIVGSAIPQVATVSGVVAAICIMQFSYTFPPLLTLGYKMKVAAAGLVEEDSLAFGELIDANTPSKDPGDTWMQWSRWKRGFFGHRWYYNLFNLILFLASLSMACLGMYGSGTAIQQTFQFDGAATSFGCTSPV